MRITVTLDAEETRNFEAARQSPLLSRMKDSAIGKTFLVEGMNQFAGRGLVGTIQPDLIVAPIGGKLKQASNDRSIMKRSKRASRRASRARQARKRGGKK